LITKTIKELSGYLNSIKIKSLILYYNHDLENRTSYNFKEKENSLYINYMYENKNFDKQVFFQMIGIMVNYENLQKIIEENFISNKEWKEFLKFLNYLSENNFMEIFLLFIFSSLKYEMIKNNKFNFNIFNTKNSFCSVDSQKNTEKKEQDNNEIKKFKELNFNICKCKDDDIYNNDNKLNNDEKSELEKVKINLEDKCQKILLIEMESLRAHLGIF
jgi:hypothetical protein